jgi:dynein heavy chain
MLAILNEKLAVQKVAVTEKTAACEALLEEIASGTKQASEKKVVAEAKGKEIEEQSVIIAVEKVCWIWVWVLACVGKHSGCV